VRIKSQFRSPVGSLDAKVTGEYWPSDLSFSGALRAERLAKLDSGEIISQVCTKTINNRALLASRSPFCTWTALFIEQPRFFMAQACRRLLHQIGLWVLDSFNLIKNAFSFFERALETIISYCLRILNVTVKNLYARTITRRKKLDTIIQSAIIPLFKIIFGWYLDQKNSDANALKN